MQIARMQTQGASTDMLLGSILISRYKSQLNVSTYFQILKESKNTAVFTYMPLTVYPLRGSRGISDTPTRHPTKIKL
jgi:hypothetical protein